MLFRSGSAVNPLDRADAIAHYQAVNEPFKVELVEAIPADQKILHAIPRDYVLDDSQEGIRNPVGMTGVRLEVDAHLVFCAQSAAANISKCVQRCGLQIDDLIFFSATDFAEALLPEVPQHKKEETEQAGEEQA